MSETEGVNNSNAAAKQALQPKEHHITIPMGAQPTNQINKKLTAELDPSASFEARGNMLQHDDSRNDKNGGPTMTKLPSQVSAESTKLLPQMTSDNNLQSAN